jgi:hypothetical protein
MCRHSLAPPTGIDSVGHALLSTSILIGGRTPQHGPFQVHPMERHSPSSSPLDLPPSSVVHTAHSTSLLFLVDPACRAVLHRRLRPLSSPSMESLETMETLCRPTSLRHPPSRVDLSAPLHRLHLLPPPSLGLRHLRRRSLRPSLSRPPPRRLLPPRPFRREPLNLLCASLSPSTAKTPKRQLLDRLHLRPNHPPPLQRPTTSLRWKNSPLGPAVLHRRLPLSSVLCLS